MQSPHLCSALCVQFLLEQGLLFCDNGKVLLQSVQTIVEFVESLSPLDVLLLSFTSASGSDLIGLRVTSASGSDLIATVGLIVSPISVLWLRVTSASGSDLIATCGLVVISASGSDLIATFGLVVIFFCL